MIDDVLNSARTKMEKSFEMTLEDLMSVRSGRATPSLVENIIVTAYEGTQKLKVLEMATITTMDAKTIVIAPYDPSVIGDIVKAIQDAKIGLNPIIDKDVIRIIIPSMSQEQRQEYLKLAKTKLEAGRVMIRQVRQEAMKQLKIKHEEKMLTEDEHKIGEKKVQELTDDMIGKIDDTGKKKEEELLLV